MNYLTKYEPRTVDEFIWPSDKAKAAILDTLATPGARFGKLHPHIFHGDYGGGKSTLLKWLPYWIDPNFQELNSLSIVGDARKNISETVQKITRFTEFQAYGGGLKVLRIDEADNLDDQIQQGLKGQITKIISLELDVLIIIATNHLERMDGGIVDRCVTVDMTQRDPERYLPKMREILAAENVDMMTDRALLPYAEAAGTSIRRLYRMMEELVDAHRAQQAQLGQQAPLPGTASGTGLTLLNQPATKQ